MTVGELENALGMTRANIRFYEREGLLEPRREPNGYREYSDEDVETLKKIKLLRQLGLPLEDIRKVQRGEQPLRGAVTEQLKRIRAERSELEWAEELCRALREDGAEYRTLNAQKYLDRMNRPAAVEGRFTIRRDEAPTVPHPWRRYFARTLDLGLYSLLWSAIQLLALRWNPDDNLFITLLETYIGYGLMFLIEPLLLATWGTTPGKWIFGLEVRDRWGRRLTWSDALLRTWGVFVQGMGYGIPIYALYRQYKSYRACANGEPLPWEEDTTYRIRDTKALRCVAFLGAEAGMLVALLLVVLQSFLPIHRGPITPAQYADNVNDMVSFLGVDTYERMDEGGSWVDTTRGNAFVINIGGDTPSHQLTVTDGEVTGVRIEMERRDDQFVTDPGYQKQLAAIALAAAQPSYNCVSWQTSGILNTIAEKGLESYTLQAGDVTIRQEVEHQGYRDYWGGGALVVEDDGVEPYFHLVFTLEKAV